MAILAESAVRVTLLAFGVAVVLRALRIRSPRLAHTAWTVVTVVMLLLPVFVAWGPRLAVPLLHTGTTPVTFAPGGSDVASAKPEDGPMTTAASEGSQPGMSWATVAMVVYVGGVGILLLRLAMGLRRTRAMRRGGLQTKGRLTHPDCVTPMTVGLVAPAVILPTDWANWDGAELSAVTCTRRRARAQTRSICHRGRAIQSRDLLVPPACLVVASGDCSALRTSLRCGGDLARTRPRGVLSPACCGSPGVLPRPVAASCRWRRRCPDRGWRSAWPCSPVRRTRARRACGWPARPSRVPRLSSFAQQQRRSRLPFKTAGPPPAGRRHGSSRRPNTS